jgi:hypothetical protein
LKKLESITSFFVVLNNLIGYNNTTLKVDMLICLIRIGRPRVGCRQLVRDNLQRTLDKLIALTDGWQSDTKHLAFKCLDKLMDFAESNITGYIPKLLLTVLNGIQTEDKELEKYCFSIARKMGLFVDLDVVLGCICGKLGSSTGVHRRYLLQILHHVVSKSSKLQINSNLDSLVDIVTHRENVCCESIDVVECVKDLMGTLLVQMDAVDDEMGFRLYEAIMLIAAKFPSECGPFFNALTTHTNPTLEIGEDQTDDEKKGSVHEMFAGTLLDTWVENHQEWTRYTPELQSLRFLFTNACTLYFHTPTVFERWINKLLLPLSRQCVTDPSSEIGTSSNDGGKVEWNISVRISAIETLVISIKQHTDQDLQIDTLKMIMNDIALENCVWRAGRPAEHLRFHATALLSTLSTTMTTGQLKIVVGECISQWKDRKRNVFDVLVSVLDDDLAETRLLIIQVLQTWLKNGIFNNGVIDGTFCATY